MRAIAVRVAFLVLSFTFSGWVPVALSAPTVTELQKSFGITYSDLDGDGIFEGRGGLDASSYVITSATRQDESNKVVRVWRTALEFDVSAFNSNAKQISSAKLVLQTTFSRNLMVQLPDGTYASVKWTVNAYRGDGVPLASDVLEINPIVRNLSVAAYSIIEIDVSDFVRMQAASNASHVGFMLQIEDDYALNTYQDSWIIAADDPGQALVGPRLVITSGPVVLDNGTVNVDTQTNLMWLDLSETANISYYGILTGVGGWLANGWRFATIDEIATLWDHMGITYREAPQGNYGELDAVNNFFVVFGLLGQDPNIGLRASQGWTDPAGTGVSSPTTANAASVCSFYDLTCADVTNLHAGWYYASPDIGSYLVKPVGSDTAPLKNFSLSTPIVAGCKTLKGLVELTSAAPVGGLVLNVSDTLASAMPPTAVIVPEGAMTKSFVIATAPVASTENGTVSVSFGATSKSQPLAVRPMGPASLTLSPTSVASGNSVSGKITLECKAGPGPVTVDLGSSNPAVANPGAANIVVPQTLQSAVFTVSTGTALSKTYATISGSANGISKSKRLTVTPAASVSSSSLRFGSVTVGATSPTLNVLLYNKGAVAFSVNSISLTGSYASWFAQSHNCPASLPAGASCTIGVTFKPLAVASRSAKLTIATSATSTPLGVSLSGTGI
jgi:hypothetical protein